MGVQVLAAVHNAALTQAVITSDWKGWQERRNLQGAPNGWRSGKEDMEVAAERTWRWQR
jgi:hypothetical protein